MADGFVQVAVDSSGKKVQTFENTVGSNLVEAEGVVLVTSAGAPYSPALDATLTGGTARSKVTDGTNNAAVKAASTAAAAADPALVVALSPNSSIPTMAAASSTPTGVVSLGNTLGKANVMKTGTLASSATTADQVILTYTVTAGKTLYLEYVDFWARLTTFAATATLFGSVSIESPAGTKLYTMDIAHAGNNGNYLLNFTEPIAIAAGVVVRVVCTPAAATAFTWRANFGGYEK
jgi:hypothetical protein